MSVYDHAMTLFGFPVVAVGKVTITLEDGYGEFTVELPEPELTYSASALEPVAATLDVDPILEAIDARRLNPPCVTCGRWG